MKYFGKFQELEDIENPYDFEELNNILITQNIGRITGHENFEACIASAKCLPVRDKVN